MTLFRTALIYALLLLAMRLLGKRQLGELELSELVVTVLVADIAVRPIVEENAPFFSSLAPLLVLWRTTMPSVLVEVGFLSSSTDRKSLTDKASKAKMADCIYDAFVSYKKKYDPSSEPLPSEPLVAAAEPADTVVVASPDLKPKAASSDTLYRVQIFAVSSKLQAGASALKGEKDFECIPVGGLYKYVIGKYKSRSEADAALVRLKGKFPGAFLVRTDSENRFLK